MKASKTRVIKDSSIAKFTGSKKIALKSYKQRYVWYVSTETFSINICVKHAEYELLAYTLVAVDSFHDDARN